MSERVRMTPTTGLRFERTVISLGSWVDPRTGWTEALKFAAVGLAHLCDQRRDGSWFYRLDLTLPAVFTREQVEFLLSVDSDLAAFVSDGRITIAPMEN